jgi:hypothetical protein
LIDDGESPAIVAKLLNVARSTLYLSLAKGKGPQWSRTAWKYGFLTSSSN